MRNDRNSTILASLFALFMIPAAMAEAPAEQTDAQVAKEKVEQEVKQAAEQQPQGKSEVSDQAAAAGTEEPPDGEIDPSAEPEAVVKTKTKSNQSND